MTLRQALIRSVAEECGGPRVVPITHVFDRLTEPTPRQAWLLEAAERLRQQRITEGE